MENKTPFRLGYTTFIVCCSYGYVFEAPNGDYVSNSPEPQDLLTKHCNKETVQWLWSNRSPLVGSGSDFEQVYDLFVPYYVIEPGVDDTEFRYIDFRRALIDAKKVSQQRVLEVADAIVEHGQLLTPSRT